MRRTCKLYKHEHFVFDDGEVLDRDYVTVEPFGKTLEGRTVWADVDDDSCLYTLQCGLLWMYSDKVF